MIIIVFQLYKNMLSVINKRQTTYVRQHTTYKNNNKYKCWKRRSASQDVHNYEPYTNQTGYFYIHHIQPTLLS